MTIAPNCVQQPAFHDYSNTLPARGIKSYRVLMKLNYLERGGAIAIVITSHGRTLSPWQRYAGYWLTGGYVLYGNCGKGFVIGQVFGTPQAHPSHFDDPGTPEDRAAFDPESASAIGIKEMQLGYTCHR